MVQFNSDVSIFFQDEYTLIRVGQRSHPAFISEPFCTLCSVVFYEIGSTNVCCIDIYNIFLMYCSLFSFVVAFFISSGYFWLEACFVSYEYSYSNFIFDLICLEYFFPSFYFVFMSLLVRYVSCKRIVGSHFLKFSHLVCIF